MKLAFKLLLLSGLGRAAKLGHMKGWIDPDTPESARSTFSLVDGRSLDLIFSDEFNVAGRSFRDGHDPRWMALHKNDYTNNALHFYDQDYVTTTANGSKNGEGYLNITTDAKYTTFTGLNDSTHEFVTRTKNFKSGMLQGWNKFCFTGGVIEVRAQLPGKWFIGGFWPAIWLMGNLARATYVATSDWVWPWSFDTCDRSLQPKQSISACNPWPHYDMESFKGRGAPEIDMLEAMPGWSIQLPTSIYKPYVSSSLQIAPGDSSPGRPRKGGYPKTGSWYVGMEYGNHTEMNVFFYGSATTNVRGGARKAYQSDAISGNTQMYGSTWDSFNTYRLEWQLPASDSEKGLGYVRWFLNDELVFGIRGETLKQKMGSSIPSEPSYIIINNAMSATWGFPEAGEFGCPAGCDCSCYDCLDTTNKCSCGFDKGFCASLPGYFLVDFVRVWQHTDDPHEKVGCSTPERPTATWIKGHAKDYSNPGSSTPLEPLVSGGGACAAVVGGGGNHVDDGDESMESAGESVFHENPAFVKDRRNSKTTFGGVTGALTGPSDVYAQLQLNEPQLLEEEEGGGLGVRVVDVCGFVAGRGECVPTPPSPGGVLGGLVSALWQWLLLGVTSSTGGGRSGGGGVVEPSPPAHEDDWPIGSSAVEVPPAIAAAEVMTSSPTSAPTTRPPSPHDASSSSSSHAHPSAQPTPPPPPPPPPSGGSGRSSDRRTIVPGTCVCSPEFVGPWCGAAAAGDPQVWTHPYTLGAAVGPVWPSASSPVWGVALSLALALGLTCALQVAAKRQQRTRISSDSEGLEERSMHRRHGIRHRSSEEDESSSDSGGGGGGGAFLGPELVGPLRDNGGGGGRFDLGFSAAAAPLEWLLARLGLGVGLERSRAGSGSGHGLRSRFSSRELLSFQGGGGSADYSGLAPDMSERMEQRMVQDTE